MPFLMVCWPYTLFSLLYENHSPPRSMAEYVLTTRKSMLLKAQGVLSRTDVLSSQYKCWHTPAAHQQSNTDQQMSFRNR